MRWSIENKLETRESRMYDFSHKRAWTYTHPNPSEAFGRTRLKNKGGTMPRKRVLATTSDGHLNGGTRRTREKDSSRWTHEVLHHHRRGEVCIGPMKLALFSATATFLLLLSPFRRRLAKFPHLAGRCTRKGHACALPPSSLSVPWAPRVTPIKKDCLTIRRGSNIALEGALVLCSAGRLQ